MSAAVSQEKFFYGGQAVLEGVMMRGRTTYAVAVRKPDGEIQVLRERLRSIIYTHRFWKLPLLRGLAGLWEQLHLGMKALVWSANIQAAGEQVELSANAIRITMGIAIIGALLFFLGVPLLAAGFLSRGHGSLFFGIVDGVVRMLASEFIRFAGRHRNNPIVKVLIIPFLLTQKLTTREPDDRQLEVALAAFQGARQEEKEAAA